MKFEEKGILVLENREDMSDSALSKINEKDFRKIVLEPDINEVPGDWFGGFKNLKCIEMKGVKTVNEGAFYKCNKLEKVIAPNLENLGNSVFLNCSKLNHVKALKLKVIGKGAFSGCKNLKKLYIPEETYDKYKEEFEDTKVTGVSK